MAITVYCRYQLFNEDTGQCLKSGEKVNSLSFWDDDHRTILTLKDIYVYGISEDRVKIVLDLDNFESRNIKNCDVIGWT